MTGRDEKIRDPAQNHRAEIHGEQRPDPKDGGRTIRRRALLIIETLAEDYEGYR